MNLSIDKTNTKDRLNENLNTLKKYDMKKEAKQLSNFVESIIVSEEVKSYFRRKNKLYRYDLKYKDDMKALAEDIHHHQDDIYDGYYSENMRSNRE